jgi:hypothetical protein
MLDKLKLVLRAACASARCVSEVCVFFIIGHSFKQGSYDLGFIELNDSAGAVFRKLGFSPKRRG